MTARRSVSSGLLAASIVVVAGAACRAAHPPTSAQGRPANQPPIGVIEVPGKGGHVSGTFTVAGWAADDRGIRELRVHVDGQLVALAGLQVPRPDVTKVYPHLAHGNDLHGWTTTVRVTTPGTHILSLSAIDSDGAVTSIPGPSIVVDAANDR